MSGGVPTPKKLSAASITMAKPRLALAKTMYGAIQFGSKWRKTMRVPELPMALADSI